MSVLLCDEQVLFADALARALRGVGHDVTTALADPDTLIAAVDREHPDLCLMGVNRSGSSVLEVAVDLRVRCPEMVVVLLTAANDVPMWEALAAGAIQGIIAKRCGLRELDRVIRSALIGRRAIGGVIPPQRSRPPELWLTHGSRKSCPCSMPGCPPMRWL